MDSRLIKTGVEFQLTRLVCLRVVLELLKSLLPGSTLRVQVGGTEVGSRQDSQDTFESPICSLEDYCPVYAHQALH